MKMCINLRVQEFEKLAAFCKVTKYNKKDVIMQAVAWQFDNLEDTCLTYGKSRRRTAAIIISDDEMTDLQSLADFMNCTPAQAGLISVRNFVAANEEGKVKFFDEVEMEDVPETFMVAIPTEVTDVIPTGTPTSKAIREALRLCQDAPNLPPLAKRGKSRRPLSRAYFPKKEDREILESLMRKFNDSRGSVVSRCLALVHLYDYKKPESKEEDLELF